MDSTLSIPDDLLCNILCRLSLKEKLVASQVNRRFHDCLVRNARPGSFGPLLIDVTSGAVSDTMHDHGGPGGGPGATAVPGLAAAVAETEAQAPLAPQAQAGGTQQLSKASRTASPSISILESFLHLLGGRRCLRFSEASVRLDLCTYDSVARLSFAMGILNSDRFPNPLRLQHLRFEAVGPFKAVCELLASSKLRSVTVGELSLEALESETDLQPLTILRGLRNTEREGPAPVIGRLRLPASPELSYSGLLSSLPLTGVLQVGDKEELLGSGLGLGLAEGHPIPAMRLSQLVGQGGTASAALANVSGIEWWHRINPEDLPALRQVVASPALHRLCLGPVDKWVWGPPLSLALSSAASLSRLELEAWDENHAIEEENQGDVPSGLSFLKALSLPPCVGEFQMTLRIPAGRRLVELDFMESLGHVTGLTVLVGPLAGAPDNGGGLGGLALADAAPGLAENQGARPAPLVLRLGPSLTALSALRSLQVQAEDCSVVTGSASSLSVQVSDDVREASLPPGLRYALGRLAKNMGLGGSALALALP